MIAAPNNDMQPEAEIADGDSHFNSESKNEHK
jgi:hypothetical protein